jgi:rhamnulokinase
MKILPVVAPATHDTGSAVAGAPLQDGWAYISSGTWSLVGVERTAALINEEVARQNFSNEGGVFGTIRFLKNVMGLWILESCRREWQQLGATIDYDVLLRDVAAPGDCCALIFPDDSRFLNPPSMLAVIAVQLRETNQTMPSEPAAIAKVILDSLAFRYASVLRTIESLTNQRIEGVQIIGGGSQNNYLNQATANATGLTVYAGPVEATAIGNVLVQAIASGRFASLAEARQYVASKVRSRKFTAQVSAGCEEARRRYAELEARYVAQTV